MLKRLLKQFLQIDSKRKTLIIGFLILALVRLLWLDRVPPNLSHDEVEYYLNSLSYWQTGSDLSGYSFPLSLFRTETSGKVSAVVPIILSPYTAITEMNIVYARLPYVILSFITSYLLYLIVVRLINDKFMAVTSMFLFLISPWSMFLSRWAADTPFALLFYLFAVYFLLSKKRYKFQLSFTFFILGFFSYHGAKPLLIPLALVVSVYQYLVEKTKTNAKKTVLFIVAILLFFGGYLFAEINIKGTPGSGRFTDIAFMDKERISKIVDEERRMQLENPVRNITSNKLTASFALMFEKYLNSYSPDTLFLSGDPRATYRFGSYGLLHIYDLLLIPLGAMYLYKKKRRETFLLLSVAVVSPAATALSIIDTSVVHRSFFLLPVLIIFSAAGFKALSVITKRKYFIMILTMVLIIPVYLYFLHYYFLRTPVINQENYFLSERVLAKYLLFKNDETRYRVIDTDPREVYLQYIFTSGNKDLNNVMDKAQFINGSYKYKSIEFTDECPDEFEENVNYIVSRRMSCFTKIISEAVIIDQKDAGGVFRIQKDYVCEGKEKDTYRRFSFMGDYNFSGMGKEDFCRIWINKI
jgi:hypothetical protein